MCLVKRKKNDSMKSLYEKSKNTCDIYSMEFWIYMIFYGIHSAQKYLLYFFVARKIPCLLASINVID